ncbi:MAG: hypothetical protein WCH20_16520, partial [Nitrospira sp.]
LPQPLTQAEGITTPSLVYFTAFMRLTVPFLFGDRSITRWWHTCLAPERIDYSVADPGVGITPMPAVLSSWPPRISLQITVSTRMIHECFCCNPRFADATSLTAGRLATGLSDFATSRRE